MTTKTTTKSTPKAAKRAGAKARAEGAAKAAKAPRGVPAKRQGEGRRAAGAGREVPSAGQAAEAGPQGVVAEPYRLGVSTGDEVKGERDASAERPTGGEAAEHGPSIDAVASVPERDAPVREAAPTGEPVLPPVGTVLRKVDRSGAVRCECTVEAEGRIRYRSALYTSLSGAAAAAAADLGLTSKSLNGWVWWGLTKSARKGGAPRGKDPVKALERAWTAFCGRLNALFCDGLADEARERLAAAVRERADALAAVARAAGGDEAA